MKNKIKKIGKVLLIIILIVIMFNSLFMFGKHEGGIPGSKCVFIVNKVTKTVRGTVTTYNSATEESSTKKVLMKLTDNEYKELKEAVKRGPFDNYACRIID